MIVYPQSYYTDKRDSGYGCGVNSVIKAVGNVAEQAGHFIDEFTDHDMNHLLEIAFHPSIMHGNCYVKRWDYVALCVLEVLGLTGIVERTVFKMERLDVFRIYSTLPTNAYIFEHRQIDRPNWYHFKLKDFNPDRTVNIEQKACGLRGLYIDIK